MNKLSNLPSFYRLEREASRWLAALDAKGLLDCDEADLAALAEESPDFAKWLSQSDSHRVAFLQIMSTWERIERLDEYPSMDKAEQIKPRFVLIEARQWIAMAASLVILVGSALVLLPSGSPNNFETEIGERRVVALAEGSNIELNSNTKISVTLIETERIVTLSRGEAFFDISHDKSRPFRVITGGQVITVLGTKFSVHKRKTGVEVIVFAGKVQVDNLIEENNSESAIVLADSIAISENNKIIVLKQGPEAVSRELSWRTGMIVFDGTTLADAAEEFNRYSRPQIFCKDPSIANLRVSGQFHSDNYTAFLRLLSDEYGLKISRSDNGKTIEISG